MIYTIGYLYGGNVQCSSGADADGRVRWVRAVPERASFGRLRAAWAVLTGRAEALRWPEPGELEDALARR